MHGTACDTLLFDFDGVLYLVDVNDWPSFRGCRTLAAERIAQRLLTQARKRGVL